VPVITLALQALEQMGISRTELQGAILPTEAARLLGPLLTSRGFDMSRPVRIIELATGEGFVLTQ
jgi:hypothetical protein